MIVLTVWSPLQYCNGLEFKLLQYIDEQVIPDLSVITNQHMVQDSVCNLNRMPEEIKIFLGISVYMKWLEYPRIEMS